jgi:hypothetical protein
LVVEKPAMATWKIVAMVLLVVLPGGGLVLLALAGYRAYKNRSDFRTSLANRERWAAPFTRLARAIRLGFAAPNRA